MARTWAGWRQALIIVAPDTVLRWHRRRFREHWARLSGRPTRGRPPVNAEIIVLVRKMAAANPLWGAPRIHGELVKLGIDVAERTVSRLIANRRAPPSRTWRTFLANHVGDLVSIDFFTVATARLRVLFVLVVLAHHRRHVLHFNVTEHPTADWTAQQIVDTFPDDTARAYLLRDRDRIHGDSFRRRVLHFNVTEHPTAAWTAQQIVDTFPEDSACRALLTGAPPRGLQPRRGQHAGRTFARPGAPGPTSASEKRPAAMCR